MPRKSYRAEICEEIRDRIQRGEIGRDARLVDTVIAAERGVSRMPVREALLQLAHEGYLEGTSRGFALPNLSFRQIMDVFELRRLLEPQAAAQAAQSLDAAGLAALGEALETARAAWPDGDITVFIGACERFRNGWLDAVPNGELRQVIQRYLAQVQTVRMATMNHAPTRRVVVDGQGQLLEAFRAGDALAAQHVMLRFVLQGEDSYRALAREEQAAAG